jgi:hypothetical protein
MANRNSKRKPAAGAKKRLAVKEPKKPSALARYIVARQAVIGFASAIPFMISGVFLLVHCAVVPVVWTGSGKNKLRLVAG